MSSVIGNESHDGPIPGGVAEKAREAVDTYRGMIHWAITLGLACWIWIVDAEHPPDALIDRLGRIEGKIEEHAVRPLWSTELLIEIRGLRKDLKDVISKE